MPILRFNEFPDGSGSLTDDDIFLFMDDPAASGITKKISLSQVSSVIGGGISNIVEDTTPQLGGNLDINNFNIVGTGNFNVSGNVTANSGNFNTVLVNGTGVSISGHSHSAGDISNFNSSVSGLLPVTDIVGSGNINVTNVNKSFTISSSGLVQSNTNGIAGASGVNNIVVMSQANYDSIVTKDPNTIYFVT